MKKIVLIFSSIIFTVFISQSLLALTEQKFAVVNMENVFENYYKTKIENARIQKQSDVYREYLVELNKSREKLQVEFVKYRDAAQNIAYTDTERESNRISAQNKYRQLQAKDAEIQQYNMEKREQLMQEYQKVKLKLVDEIMTVIKSIGEREDYTLIFDTSGRSLNSVPSVVYHDKYIDISQEVIKTLNMGNEARK